MALPERPGAGVLAIDLQQVERVKERCAVAASLLPRDPAVAVVLDLVDPLRGREARVGMQGSTKPAWA
jgi:hypothetical protein